ncbi:hypothetical protein [Mycobacteroides abscessus]|uniref:hypothetical protein n=1 Tax=Mycobacteroides abscessus TaxID=36809 RepID=UPI001878ED0A|nr:hypothetical protein [Mycobacteroides abscessus]
MEVIVGFWIQMLGNLVTGLGLLFAWYRASGRFIQWRKAIRQSMVELRAGIAELRGDNIITPGAALIKIEGGTPDVSVSDQPVTPEERIRGLVDSAFAREDKQSKVFQRRDIYPALCGLIISTIGSFIEHLPIFQR